MIEVNHLVDKREACRYCGKREATQLCDMPKRTTVARIGRSYIQTCDNPTCPDCAMKFRAFELCPDCVLELRQVLEPKGNQGMVTAKS